MSLVIMTKRCYLVCESVTSIILEQVDVDSEYIEKKPSLFKKKQMVEVPPPREWQIEINYVPPKSMHGKNANGSYNNSNGNGEEQCISVIVATFAEGEALFKEIVTEIREQSPDLLYLDKLIEKVLCQPLAQD